MMARSSSNGRSASRARARMTLRTGSSWSGVRLPALSPLATKTTGLAMPPRKMLSNPRPPTVIGQPPRFVGKCGLLGKASPNH